MTTDQFYKIDNSHLYQFSLNTGEKFIGILEGLVDDDNFYLIKTPDISKRNEAIRKHDMETLKEVRRPVNIENILDWKPIPIGLDKVTYHRIISKLRPCLNHGYEMATYLNEIGNILSLDTIFIEKAKWVFNLEQAIRDSLKNSSNDHLNNQQLSDFFDIQRNIVEFLS
jgi:hypothetical protein